MSLIGPYLTTTSTKKREVKITKSMQLELEQGHRDRNQRLKEMHLPKETFEQYLEFAYGRGKKEKKVQAKKANCCTKQVWLPIRDFGEKVASHVDQHTGACSSKPPTTYTGSKIIGIGILHKSCLQPIFSTEEAIEISKMRR